MRPRLKRFSWMLGLGLSLQSAWAFVLGGPIGNGGDVWQNTVIGYGLPGDLAAPKNIGEGYRRNTPVMYYAFDQSFLGYFGSNGVSAVDAAFVTLNRAFTNSPSAVTNGVDGYSPDLSEFPFNSQHFNYQAQALGLTDLKSEMLVVMMEQLGLTTPERYVWALHNRFLPPGGRCPINEEYWVTRRNFPPTASPLNQTQYSSYVNNTLYTYIIDEHCTGLNPLAITIPSPVDVESDVFDAVASGINGGWLVYINGILFSGNGLEIGGYFNSLTRDDVAGLRYLLTTNNFATESPSPDSSLQSFAAQSIQLPTLDLASLLQSAQTNDPTLLPALFPGLQVAGSSNYWVLAAITNLATFFTNYIGEPFGTPPHLIIVTNISYVPQQRFVTTFGNVTLTTNIYPGSFHTNSRATLLTTNISVPVGAPVGSPPRTNVTTQTITLTNVPSGDYFLFPAGSCGYNILFTIQTNVVTNTTVIVSAFTNDSQGQLIGYSQSLSTYFTNHIFIAYPCSLVAPPTELYQGVQRLRFVRANFDSLLGQFFQPITNVYNMVMVSNSHPVKLTFERVLFTPDFVFAASDMLVNTPAGPADTVLSRNVNFNQNNIMGGLAGPGTIDTPTRITLNKVGDVLETGSLALFGLSTNQFLMEADSFPLLAWASFDGTTNDPVVYPNGTSIQNLQNQILIQLFTSPTFLPDGTNDVAYGPVTFSASGGQPPYSWSASGLPQGLGLDPNTGVLAGTPTNNPAGTYDFSVQMTDSANRSVSLTYPLTIH